MTRYELVAVWCDHCRQMVPVSAATRVGDGWECRAHRTNSREGRARAWAARMARRRAVVAQDARKEHEG